MKPSSFLFTFLGPKQITSFLYCEFDSHASACRTKSRRLLGKQLLNMAANGEFDDSTASGQEPELEEIRYSLDKCAVVNQQ